jgi:hypothetical protein
MDADEPEQLYRTLLIEQEMNPSQIVSILVEYYKMSEDEANLVSREYHAKLGEKNGRNRSSRS